jgi:hypothetical protein
VKSIKSEENLSGIEFGLFFGESVFQGEKAEELASRAVLEDEVEFVFVLEALLQAHKEGVLEFDENGLFGHDVFFLVLLQDVLLLEDFHRVDLLVFQLADEKYFGIGAFADD